MIIGTYRMKSTTILLLTFVVGAKISAKDLTYRIDSNSARLSYLVSPEGPGIARCQPNDYQCDLTLLGDLRIKLSEASSVATIIPNIRVSGNEEAFRNLGHAPIDTAMMSDWLADRRLVRSTNVTQPQTFIETMTINREFKLTINETGLTLTGGPDSRPADGAGFEFSMTAHLRGDFDRDGHIGLSDIHLLNSALHQPAADPLFDLNLDDVVDMQDHQIWVVDEANTGYGDANLDGDFGTGDLVQVFQFGEYEDASPLNSEWEEGDWNGDRDFTSDDFVRAFSQTNSICYEATCGPGPRPAVAVPEPHGAVLWLAGMSFLLFVPRSTVTT